MMEFSQKNRERFQTLLTRYPNKQAALLPTLWLVQEQFGYISEPAMKYVAGLLGISPIHVFSVVTFYTMFQRQPVGKYHLQICGTLSCALRGSETLCEHLKRKLGIDIGETTGDGKFTLSTVECLASCGTAPAMMVNEKYFENLDLSKVDELLSALP